MSFENDIRAGIITEETPGVDPNEVRAILAEQKPKEARALPGTKKFSFRDVEDMGVEADVMITPPETDDTLGGKVLRILGFIGDNRIDSFSDFFSWFRTSMVDMWDPARRTEVGLSEQDSKYAHFLTASSSAWAALRQARRGTAITAYALAKGVPVYRGGWSRVEGIPEDAQQTNLDGSKTKSRIAGQQVGLIPIIEPLRSGTKKSGHRFKAFHEYAIARRAARLFREGREKLLTQEQIVLYLATGHGAAEIASLTQLPLSKVNEILSGKNITRNDDFNQIFMDYQVWNSYFVQFLVDTGLITADQAVQWTETADYIPFYRQLDPEYTETIGGPDVFSGVSTRPPPPLGGKGSIWTIVINQTIDGKKVLTRLPTTFHRAEKKVAEGYAKKIAQENTGSTQGTPEFKVSVIAGGMPIGGFLDTVSENALAAVQTGLMNVGVQRAMRNLVLADPTTTTRMKNPPAGKKPPPGAITFRVKGNPVTLHVGDTMLYSSFLNLNKQVSPITNMIGMPARVLRELITRSPDFMVANMLRDSLSAWVTSGRNITPLASTFTGFYKAMRGDKSADALAAAGLMTGFDFGGDPSKMTQFIEKELLNYEYPSEARKAIRNPLKYIWDATGKASRSSDAATRIAVYNRVLQETGDEAQAIFEAQEVINFSARGSSPLLQFFAATVPFLNARIQGIDVLYRSSMGKKGFAARPESDIVKRRFLARAITVASTSAMYWVLVHDDEEYINQNPEIKDNYWILPSAWIPGYDGMPLRLPIPFEVGFLFKVIPERVMAQFFGQDVPRDITNSLRRGLVATFEFNPFGVQAIRPALEVVTDYSFFTGREIEGKYLEGVEPGYRYNSRTSGLARDLGETLNYSPVKIDHMIKGYGGTLGSVTLDIVDQVYRSVREDLGETQAWKVTDYPFMKRFFARPDARGLITQFYDLNNSVMQAVKTAKRLEAGELTIAKSEDFIERRERLIDIEKEVAGIADELAKLRAERLEILEGDFDADFKRDMIDMITEDELAVVQDVPSLREEALGLSF